MDRRHVRYNALTQPHDGEPIVRVSRPGRDWRQDVSCRTRAWDSRGTVTHALRASLSMLHASVWRHTSLLLPSGPITTKAARGSLYCQDWDWTARRGLGCDRTTRWKRR